MRALTLALKNIIARKTRHIMLDDMSGIVKNTT